MSISELQSIAKKLQDPYQAIDVWNAIDGSNIASNVFLTDILETHASVEDYLKDFYRVKNISRIIVFNKRKNGSSFRKKDEGIRIVFNSENDQSNTVVAETTEDVAAPQNTPTPQIPMENTTGMFGVGSNFGLGLPQLMKMNTDASNYADVKERNKSLEAENKRLEKNNATLEREKFKLELDKKSLEEQVSKKPFLDPETIKVGMSSLPAMLAAFTKNATGMAAPAPKEVLMSGPKQTLIDTIKMDEFPDELATELSIMLSIEDEAFLIEVRNLINKYKKAA